MKAVILAGGKGRRLLPYTTNFPKPLMPIGDRPILEIVIKQLKENGITEIIIATGYLEEIIRAFFADGVKLGVNITYSKEEEPLGTAGPLNHLRRDLKDTFLLMNGDILTDMDFSQLLKYHKSHGAVATVAVCKRTVNIDFGVVNLTDKNLFSDWKEKPHFDYLVSTGVYILEPGVFEVMPNDGFFNLPDLILALHDSQKPVYGYLHEGYWLDIGRAEDYEKACKDYGKVVKC